MRKAYESFRIHSKNQLKFMSKFISCDWGTTNLRLRIVDFNSKIVLKEIQSADGIASVFRTWNTSAPEVKKDRIQFYFSYLQKHLLALENETSFSLHDLPIVISGMASSSIGVMELEYKPIPVYANGSDLLVRRIEALSMFSNAVYIVSGLSTPKDVLRGEETLLAGCDTLAQQDEIFVFPGTHSKHIYVSDGKVESFNTYMTGEFFELLSKHSILSPSIASHPGFSDEFFERGVRDGVSMNLLNAAFQVRVNQLFKISGATENFDYLSGLLVGYELKEIGSRSSELITVVSSPDLNRKYLSALKLLGLSHKSKTFDAAHAIVVGHCKIYGALSPGNDDFI